MISEGKLLNTHTQKHYCAQESSEQAVAAADDAIALCTVKLSAIFIISAHPIYMH